MRKLLLTLLAAGTALWAASAGTVRILDAAPGGGGAPVRQLALLQGLEKGSGEFRIETLPPEEALRQLEAGKADVHVLTSADKWHGITYREDKPELVAALKKMSEDGLYPADKLF